MPVVASSEMGAARGSLSTQSQHEEGGGRVGGGGSAGSMGTLPSGRMYPKLQKLSGS